MNDSVSQRGRTSTDSLSTTITETAVVEAKDDYNRGPTDFVC